MDFKNFSKFRIFSIKKKILYNNLFAIKRFWSNQKKKKKSLFQLPKNKFFNSNYFYSENTIYYPLATIYEILLYPLYSAAEG